MEAVEGSWFGWEFWIGVRGDRTLIYRAGLALNLDVQELLDLSEIWRLVFYLDVGAQDLLSQVTWNRNSYQTIGSVYEIDSVILEYASSVIHTKS
jgi:hypothetical protein